ncbi:hypothetical protein PSPO01_05689 [Paraphaeosphaeria sporulosa]
MRIASSTYQLHIPIVPEWLFSEFYHISAGPTYLVAAKGFRTDEAQQEQHVDNASTSRPHEQTNPGCLTRLGFRLSTLPFTTMLCVEAENGNTQAPNKHVEHVR